MILLVLLIQINIVCRYRSLLENVLSNSPTELVETLQLFIEASKQNICLQFQFIVWGKQIEPSISQFSYIVWIYFTVVNEHVSLVISRQLLSDVGNQLAQLADDVSKVISHFTLDKVLPRVISFEEQVANIRQHLAQIYEREENWREAANVLVGIPLETGQKYTSLLQYPNKIYSIFINFVPTDSTP